MNCILVYGTPCVLEYTPGFPYFSYWLDKLVPDPHKVMATADENSPWVRYVIRDAERASQVEQLALAQWGPEGVRVQGVRPKGCPTPPKWPETIFPFSIEAESSPVEAEAPKKNSLSFFD